MKLMWWKSKNMEIRLVYALFFLTALILGIIGAVYGLRENTGTRANDAGIAAAVGAGVSLYPPFTPLGIIAGSLAIHWSNRDNN